MREILDDSDPGDKQYECMADVLGYAIPKDIALVHIVLGIKGDNLLDLPEWMHALACACRPRGNHIVESKLTSTVISHRMKLLAAGLGHCMNGHTVYSWQQIWAKRP